jgi:microcystin-dependent protein
MILLRNTIAIFFVVMLALPAHAAQPPPYNPAVDFSTQNFDASMMAKLKVEFDNLQATMQALLSNIAQIQRADLKLKNSSVHPSAIDGSTLALFAAAWAPRGQWTTATAYSVRDVASYQGGTYLCAIAHASDTFQTDLDAGKWVQIGAASASGGSAGELTTAAITSGSGAAYSVSFDPAFAEIIDVPALMVTWHTNNTGAATLQVDGLAAKPLSLAGQNPGVDALVANQTDVVIYNSATDSFHLVGRDPQPAGTAASDLWQIGDVRMTGRATEATGWVWLNGRTIGNVGSGATLESADFESLFEIAKTWACNNGTESWGAGNTVKLCDMRGRVLGVRDDLGGSSANVVTHAEADKTAGATGAELVTLTSTQLPAHSHTTASSGSHTHTFPVYRDSSITLVTAPGDTGFTFVGNASTSSAGSHTHTVNSAGSGAAFSILPPVSFFRIEVKYQ